MLLKRDSDRDAVLEVMPLPEKRSIVLETVGGETKDLRSTVSSGQNDLLLDTENTPAGNTAHSQQNAQDLLLDIFGGSNEPAPPAVSATASRQDILAQFDTPSQPPVAHTTSALSSMNLLDEPESEKPQALPVYNKNGFSMALNILSHGADVTVQACFTCTTDVQHIIVQAAVRKKPLQHM